VGAYRACTLTAAGEEELQAPLVAVSAAGPSLVPLAAGPGAWGGADCGWLGAVRPASRPEAVGERQGSQRVRAVRSRSIDSGEESSSDNTTILFMTYIQPSPPPYLFLSPHYKR
jgi:hypothetical protein